MALPIAAAAIGAFASGATSMMNSSSQAQTNAQNYKMFREQMAYDKWKFQQEKRYNSYQNQVRQMRAAGLNPALMAGGLSSSISAGSAPSGNPMQAVDYSGAVNAGANLLQSFYNARQSEATTDKLQSETDLNRIDAITRGIQNLFDIKVKTADWQLKNSTNQYQRRLAQLAGLDVELAQQTMGDKILQQKWNTELTRAQASAGLIALKYIEPQQQANVKLALSQAAAAYVTSQASLKQAHNAMMEVYAKYGGSPKERGQYFQATLDYLRQQKNESESSEFKNFLTAPGRIGLSSVEAASPVGVKRASAAARHHR